METAPTATPTDEKTPESLPKSPPKTHWGNHRGNHRTLSGRTRTVGVLSEPLQNLTNGTLYPYFLKGNLAAKSKWRYGLTHPQRQGTPRLPRGTAGARRDVSVVADTETISVPCHGT